MSSHICIGRTSVLSYGGGSCLLVCFTVSRNSHGRALEHLESFGPKIMMRGSIVRQSCKRGGKKHKETDYC